LLLRLKPAIAPKASHQRSSPVRSIRTSTQARPSQVSAWNMSVEKSTPWIRKIGPSSTHKPASHCANRPPPSSRANSAVNATKPLITKAGSRRKPSSQSPNSPCAPAASSGTKAGWST